MNVEVEQLPESRVALTIELTGQEVDQAAERTYKQLVQRVNVPGFRRGKAPRAMVERHVGPEFFLHEATDEAVRWGYRRAVDDKELTPIDEAEISPAEDGHGHIHPGEPFTFTATVAVKPEVKLPDYTTIHLDKPEVTVDDQEVEDLLTRLRESTATLEPTVRAPEIGDVVTLNVVAKVGGEEVVNEENFDFELRDENEPEGASPLFPGLSAELVGANRGDIREITLQLPETYANPELAGKTMFVRALVKEVKRKVLPEADDEFAQSVSDLQTLDELKARLRENLLLEKRLAADEALVNEAVEAVTSRSFVEIPPILIEEELDRMMRDMRTAFEARRLSLDTFLETTGRSEEAMRAEMHDEGVANVKASLVLGAVADREKIDISTRDIEQGIADMTRGMNMSESERRRLRSSSNVRANVRSRLRRQRAIQRLVEIMTGAEVPAEATETVTDQTAAAAEDTEETVAVEMGS